MTGHLRGDARKRAAEAAERDEISEALAQAWDEGWHEANWDGTTTNPYRSDA